MARVTDLAGRTVVSADLSPGDERLALVLDDGSTLSVEVDHAPQPGYSANLRIRLVQDYSAD
jgi:hypothetical protein